MVREFRKEDIVQSDDRVIKSSDRNEPKTAGRLVKLKPTVAPEPEAEEPTAANSDNEESNAQAQSNTSANEPATGGEGDFETQSGDGSNNGEQETGTEDQSQLLPTLTDINTSEQAETTETQPQLISEQAPSATKPLPAKSALKKKSVSPTAKKEPQFEEESKVHEAEDSPIEGEEASSQSTVVPE